MMSENLLEARAIAKHFGGVKALTDVAKGMGKQVIAEWVETPEVLKILQDIGAQYGQGYLFSKPVPLQDRAEYGAAVADGYDAA